MTTLYKPVLIESAEQAEQLPDDAIVISDGGDRYRRSGRDWMGVAGELPGYLDVDLLCNERITALVPIEAEEEWAAEFESGEMYVNLDEDSARAADGGAAMSRLVTPWEAV